MAAIAISGQDTLLFDGSFLMTDLGDGDVIKLTYPNELAVIKIGKNQNAIYASNSMGFITEMTVRALLASNADKYLNSRMQQQFADFSSFSLITAAFTKRIGDGKGNINAVVYQISGGVFKKPVESMTNVEGNTEQSLAVYTVHGILQTRTIQ